MMQLGYNTNGLAHHRLDDALAMLADLGYGGVAITPDVPHLDPRTTTQADCEAVRRRLEELQLRCVVETGARYTLDPRRKHWPNLVSVDEAAAARRLNDYHRGLELAAALGAEAMSLWSGAPEEGTEPTTAWELLLRRLSRVLDAASGLGVRVAFEPEPGMLVDDLVAYRRLRTELGRDDLYTTIDVGHLLVTEPGAPDEHLAGFADSLANVQLDDARRGVHEHLVPGEGEIEFAPVFAELHRIGYKGLVALELSRDSHRAHQVARDAIALLGPMLERHGPPPAAGTDTQKETG